jgi:outer membrane immunogenic protein
MRIRATGLAWASALAIGAATTANAQTFSWNWTGFYVGADGGGVFNRSVASTVANPATPPILSYLPANQLNAFNASSSNILSARGLDAGVHAGYNLQIKPFVVGVEVDYGAFKTKAINDSTIPLIPGVNGSPVAQLHTEVATNWLFTARARVGWVYSVALFYITGGLATTGISTNTSYIDNSNPAAPPNGFLAVSQTKTGFVIGGGFEIAVAPRWTLRTEYLHMEFTSVTGGGRIVAPATGAFNPFTLSADLKTDIVRVGLSHKFLWWFEEAPPPPPPQPVVVSKY